MHTGSLSFNLIKILTMAIVLAYIIFTALTDESVGHFKIGMVGQNLNMTESGGQGSFDIKQQPLKKASSIIHTHKNSRNWLPTPPPG